MSPRTRAQLISDVFSLSQANYVKTDLALELAKYLSNEFDYLPWNVFINRIKYYTDLADSNQFYADMQSFLAKIVEPYYNKLGWTENIATDSWTDRLKDFFCLKRAKPVFKKTF